MGCKLSYERLTPPPQMTEIEVGQRPQTVAN